jgi:hypothetical protein
MISPCVSEHFASVRLLVLGLDPSARAALPCAPPPQRRYSAGGNRSSHLNRASVPGRMSTRQAPALAFRLVDPRLRKLLIPAVVLGVLLIAIAIVYFVEPAHSLPSFFPGHVSSTSSEAGHHHTKHGIAALVVALACFAFAWFQTGPKAQRPAGT